MLQRFLRSLAKLADGSMVKVKFYRIDNTHCMFCTKYWEFQYDYALREFCEHSQNLLFSLTSEK